MKWKKLGRIFNTNGQKPWMQTHASLPIVEYKHDDIFRIYFSPRNSENKSHIAFIEIDINEPTKILKISEKPVMEPGKLGAFDDSGVMASCIVNHNDKKFLYYLGWNQKVTVPYSNAIGLAISHDDGDTFQRVFDGAIVDRSPTEPYFTASCEIKIENDLWRMWYLSCTGWKMRIDPDDKTNSRNLASPFYHIKYAESDDGINWKRDGKVCIDFKNEDEWATATPRVRKEGDIYKMWYSHRGVTPYRIGYAESKNGIDWNRKDEEVGINVSKEGWDSKMIEYPFVFEHKNSKYMLYNGNEFGIEGLGIAILEK
jgi:predicted GH43/DUF377 family glycosyl hydrolase